MKTQLLFWCSLALACMLAGCHDRRDPVKPTVAPVDGQASSTRGG